MIQTVPTVEEAYTLYGKKVLSICFHMLRNQEEAEDARQEVFLRLHKKIHSFKGDSQFSTWLHRVTTNTVLEMMRAKRSRILSNTFSLDQMQEEHIDGEHVGALDRALLTEDAHLNATGDRMALHAALENMPPGYRMAFDLIGVQGFTAEEAGEMMGVTRGTIKSQYHRAKRWLADEMGIEFLESEPEPEINLDELLADFGRWMEDDLDS